jgi:signal transduction histidine kinase
LITAIRLLVKDYWRQEQARQGQTLERRRLERLVGERTTELSDLTTHLQTVTEQEKAELARNLHDELGGLLTAAKMDLAWLQGRASAKEPEARGKLDALSSGLDEAMDVKRRVVENLRPALLDHFGLPTALNDHFDATCKKAGLNCKVSIPEDFERIAQDVSIALFRVGQEALTNIIRHANAKNVELTLESDEDSYRISVADDGVGIDPAKSRGAISHGLVGMRHRIDTLQGQFKIVANRPQGTRVEVTVPRARTLG